MRNSKILVTPNDVKKLIFRPVIAISTAACIALASSSVAMAKPKPGERGDNFLHVVEKLDLSEQQKLSVKAIMQQTREDNSVFVGEKQEIKLQMRDLMTMPSWDAETAGQIISAQMEQGKGIELNRAEAKHQVYQLLNDEQKAKLGEMSEQRALDDENKARGKDKARGENKARGKNHRKMQARLAKALSLSDDQKAEWKTLQQETRALKQSFAPVMHAHHEQVRAIVQAERFDASAWQAVQEAFAEQLIAHRVDMAEIKFNSMAILSDEQKQSFLAIMKKQADKRKGKRGQKDEKIDA
mgnify:CR=1 FL=1